MADLSALLPILRIGHDTSMRGAGISLREALKVTHYAKYRPKFSPEDLLPIVESDPSLVEEWMSYSEDKRTDGGWYLLRDGTVGRVGEPATKQQFESIQRAVAEYVILELDAAVGDQTENRRPVKRSYNYLIGVALISIVGGAIQQALYYREDAAGVSLAVTFVPIAIFLYLWVGADARERGVPMPLGATLLVPLVALVGVPYYLIRTRSPIVALWQIPAAIVFVIVLALLSCGGELLVYAGQH